MRVARRAKELRAEGREIVDWSAGEPDFASPAVAIQAAQQALADGRTKYTVASGIPDLRDALAETYHQRHGAPWQRPNSLVTVGAKAALFEVFQILVDDGAEVIYPTPAWVSFGAQVRLAGGVPVEVKTGEGFEITAAPLLDAVTDRTRAILINSPCNPTGAAISATELRRLVEGAAERGLVVISDETYEHFVYDGEHASSAALAAEYPDTVVLVSSFSKTWAMTGWRVGYMLGPEAIVAKAASLQGHMTSNPTSFAMWGAVAALEGADEDVRRMIEEFRWRRDFVVEKLNEIPGVYCPRPDGAFYVFPSVARCFEKVLSPDQRGSLGLAEHLLEEAGIALVPGLAFGDDDHVRISFTCSREILAAGTEKLTAALMR